MCLCLHISLCMSACLNVDLCFSTVVYLSLPGHVECNYLVSFFQRMSPSLSLYPSVSPTHALPASLSVSPYISPLSLLTALSFSFSLSLSLLSILSVSQSLPLSPLCLSPPLSLSLSPSLPLYLYLSPLSLSLSRSLPTPLPVLPHYIFMLRTWRTGRLFSVCDIDIDNMRWRVHWSSFVSIECVGLLRQKHVNNVYARVRNSFNALVVKTMGLFLTGR